VIEPAEPPHRGIEGALARMAERRMAEIMGERDRFGQIFVEAKRARQRAGDLRDFEGMGQTSPVVVALGGEEDLRLALESAESGRVDDPVAITLEGGAARRGGFVEPAAAAAVGIGRESGPDIARARPNLVRRGAERFD
jgi:hypothetical protein